MHKGEIKSSHEREPPAAPSCTEDKAAKEAAQERLVHRKGVGGTEQWCIRRHKVLDMLHMSQHKRECAPAAPSSGAQGVIKCRICASESEGSASWS